ncbi:MAG TPA: recombinase family protein [Thermosynechococcaceae cyanobacterium]
MRIIAYLYSDPLLEPAPDPTLWGWEIDQVYQDLAVNSESNPRKPARSQWQQLLQDCRTSPTSHLLIRHLQELGDSLPEIKARLAELEALNVQPVAIDFSPLPHLSANLLQQLQQLQHDQRSYRIRQGHAHNRIQSAPPPGRAPYGYRRSKNRYVIDRATAPVVKEFFEQFLLYGSLRGAVRYLAKKYNKKIAASTGHRWLINPVYRGDLEYQNGEVIADAHAPILSRDEAAQIDRLLRRNRRLPPRTASAPRSLAGLVVCGACQSTMTVAHVTAPRRSREYLYLRPIACPNRPKCRAIVYEQVLQGTIELICEQLPPAIARVNMPDMEAVKQSINGAIDAKQAILEQLPPLVVSGVLDQATADLRVYKIRTEIAALQDKRAQLPPVELQAIAQTVSLPQFWLDLSETERRFYFREFIRQVQIDRRGQDWQLSLVFAFR